MVGCIRIPDWGFVLRTPGLDSNGNLAVFKGPTTEGAHRPLMADVHCKSTSGRGTQNRNSDSLVKICSYPWVLLELSHQGQPLSQY